MMNNRHIAPEGPSFPFSLRTSMSYVKLRVHFIWSTLNRQNLIDKQIRPDLFAYIGGILRKRKHVLIAAGGVADHIHLLVGLHQTQTVADCVRDVKSNSSRWIHDNFSDLNQFAWQTKYGAFSVSQSAEKDVAAYIDNQEEHHKKVSFQNEFIAFLNKHGIEFDERFVFE